MEQYDRLKKKSKTIKNLTYVFEILDWDREVVMPEGAVKARSVQEGTIKRIRHQKESQDEIKDLIESLKDGNLLRTQKGLVREMEKDHERASSISSELITEISEKESAAVDKWRKAREEEDFEIFRPELEELVELKRKYADQIDPDAEPYKVLYHDFEPYVDLEKMDSILEQLKESLVPLLDEIRDSDADLSTDVFRGSFSEDKQEDLVRELMTELGYDWEIGRLDISTHPFSVEIPTDARIATRFYEGDLSEAITSTIHETGHALYNMGLPEEHSKNHLGQPRELGIHESQSRLWENRVGRSKAFSEFLLEKLKEKFPEEFKETTTQEVYESLSAVNEDNVIRVSSDELTYHLHIVIRYELERKLINGEIEVEDLEELWNQKMEEYLGVKPDEPSEGLLQDIHWGWGSFGYFPNYSLGSVIASQIFREIEKDVDDLEEKIRGGEFDSILEWLREGIHSKGRILETEELVEEATQEKPKADYFIEYIEEKYRDLYDL
jgi:carboxypeptidase Taq